MEHHFIHRPFPFVDLFFSLLTFEVPVYLIIFLLSYLPFSLFICRYFLHILIIRNNNICIANTFSVISFFTILMVIIFWWTEILILILIFPFSLWFLSLFVKTFPASRSSRCLYVFCKFSPIICLKFVFVNNIRYGHTFIIFNMTSSWLAPFIENTILSWQNWKCYLCP